MLTTVFKLVGGDFKKSKVFLSRPIDLYLLDYCVQ